MDDAQWVVKLKQDRRSRTAVLEENNSVLLAEVKRLRKVLESIANNCCCEQCQEAGLVARKALEGE